MAEVRQDEQPRQRLNPARLAPQCVRIPSAQEKELENQLQRIFEAIRSETGHDFSHYKRNTVKRRVARRLAVHQIDDIEEYIACLHTNRGEIRRLRKELLITVTSFFRDPKAFQILAENVVGPLVEDRPVDAPLRVWVPGCATGEEAYSIAMLLHERMTENGVLRHARVLGTDLDDEAIEWAGRGCYPKSIAEDITERRLRQFFTEQDSHYQITPLLRERLAFATHDLVQEPPPLELDLICCRNVLIYMDAALQRMVLPVFHEALNPGGFLFLGESESIGTLGHLFEPVDGRHKIFKRRESPA